jgi:peroxiredoxin
MLPSDARFTLTKTSLAAALGSICELNAPLWRKLDLFLEWQRANSAAFVDAGERLVERLRAGDFGHGAPLIGEAMPDFFLPDQEGRFCGLEELTGTGPAVISFNRGHWCPFCRIELGALTDAHRELEELGTKVVSIMPDRQQFVGRLPASITSRLTILSDIDNEFALSLGLAIWLGDEMRELLQEQGLDLDEVHGNERWCVPVPATFVIGRGGRVVARKIEPDFRERMNIEEIIAALRTAPSVKEAPEAEQAPD